MKLAEFKKLEGVRNQIVKPDFNRFSQAEQGLLSEV